MSYTYTTPPKQSFKQHVLPEVAARGDYSNNNLVHHGFVPALCIGESDGIFYVTNTFGQKFVQFDPDNPNDNHAVARWIATFLSNMSEASDARS